MKTNSLAALLMTALPLANAHAQPALECYEAHSSVVSVHGIVKTSLRDLMLVSYCDRDLFDDDGQRIAGEELREMVRECRDEIDSDIAEDQRRSCSTRSRSIARSAASSSWEPSRMLVSFARRSLAW